jgi:hypothetical protein
MSDTNPNPNPPAPQPNDDLAALKQQNADLMKRLEALEKGGNPPAPPEDPSLADKARREREENEKRSKYEKGLEGAINFNVASKDFLKSNASLLPKTIEGLFLQAEKENYGNSIEKANAIKVGIVSEFFAVQANHDLLTASQKIQLDEFVKLTKNGKQDRVESIYSMIFEPTLETLRKIEKAKQIHQNGNDQSDAEKQLADRMMKLSKKHYLGEKDA